MNAINRREMLAGLVGGAVGSVAAAEEEPDWKVIVADLKPWGTVEEHQNVDNLHQEPLKGNRDRFVWDGMGSDNGLDVFPRTTANRGDDGAPVAYVLTGDRRIAAEWMRKQGSVCASLDGIEALSKLVAMGRSALFHLPMEAESKYLNHRHLWTDVSLDRTGKFLKYTVSGILEDLS